jgi:TonB-linked SusC/RagA family outer membrane protein
MKRSYSARPFWQVLVRAIGVLGVVGIPAPVLAQGTITGRVTAIGGEPLASARVIAIGATSVATTGQDGRYTLRHLAPGNVAVQVLHIGHHPQKRIVTVEGSTSARADFEMAPRVVKLTEVVSTATGEQRKIELGHTTAILNDIGERMELSPTSLTVGDLLVQRVPGVNVLGQGMVGTAASIRIRGLSSLSLSNEPIIIVDGVRVAADVLTPGAGVGGTQTSLLNSVTPEDIETIEIIKGPAASTIYGTNAANGVIVISTKKGRAARARWTWTTEQGRIRDDNDYPGAYAIWGHAPNSTTPIRCTLATMGPATCLQDSVTSLNILKDRTLTPLNTGRRSLWGLQVNGGTEVVRFFISANVENALGPIQMPDFAYTRLDTLKLKVRGEWKNPEALQRENFRANFNATVTPQLELGATVGFVKSDQRFPQSDNSPVSLFAAARSSPGFAHPGLGYTNLGALGETLFGYNLWIPSEIFQDLSTENIQRQTMTGTMSWRARPWMQNDAVVGADYTTYTEFNVCRLNECPAYSGLRNGTSYSATAAARVMTVKLSSVSTWNARPDLNVSSTVGTEWTYVGRDNATATGIGLPPGAQNVGQGANRTGSFNQSLAAGRTWGVFVQEQAAFRDRVFVTLGLRSDQNSAFGRDYVWAHYPKIGASWLVSDESFFPKLPLLDQLRLRSAYGASGRQPALTSAFRSYKPIVASIGGSDQRGLVGDQIGNPGLKPERSNEVEVGFDARLLQNRVNLEATYFNKKTKDAILASPVAASSGASSLLAITNAGAVTNSGFETVLTTQLVDRRAFGWGVTVTASHWTNKVTSMGPRGALNFGNTRLEAGYPIDALFYRTYRYDDANDDGRLQPAEVVVDTNMRYAGYQVPRDLISVQNGFDLLSRRLRITALIDYKGGHSVLDAGAAFLCVQYPSCPDQSDPSSSLANQARSVANRYGTTIGGTPYTTAIGYLSNGRFWRLREVAANVALPDRFSRRILRAQGASLTLGARNLHVWTKYAGVDPESNFGAGDLQTDFMTAGPPRYYNLRVNLHY